MNPKDILTTTLRGLMANKGRSLLTILGIVIGISAVTTAMAVGKGAEKMIVSQVASLGSNNIFIEPGAWSERMERGSLMQSMAEEMQIKTLVNEDVLAIEKLATVDKAAPFTFNVGRVVYKEETKKVTYLGTDQNATFIGDYDAIMGRNIEEDDIRSMARVAVLGYTTWQDLFGDENPVGKTIRVKKTNFRVIGVIEEKGPQAFMDMDKSMLVPFNTAQKLLTGENFLRFVVVKAKEKDLIEPAVEQIREALRERHDIYNPEEDPAKDDFKVMSQKDTAQIIGNVTGIFTVLVSSIAAISLIVGGVGIMNIMLVSVAERTREIGLRKAVGARAKDILNQFLIESIALTSAGGILGMICGTLFSYLASYIFEYFLGSSWGFYLPWKALALSVFISFVVGLVFGIYPARKASRLSPIEALRYE